MRLLFVPFVLMAVVFGSLAGGSALAAEEPGLDQR